MISLFIIRKILKKNRFRILFKKKGLICLLNSGNNRSPVIQGNKITLSSGTLFNNMYQANSNCRLSIISLINPPSTKPTAESASIKVYSNGFLVNSRTDNLIITALKGAIRSVDLVVA